MSNTKNIARDRAETAENERIALEKAGEPEKCPNCGSKNFAELGNTGDLECYDCGKTFEEIYEEGLVDEGSSGF